MLYDTATSTSRVLAVTSTAWPTWSADSKPLYLHAFRADKKPILRVDVSTGQIRSVADLSNFRTANVSDFGFAGLTPKGVPLVHTESSSANLYTIDLAQK